jgi:D-Tyr-tRNAtyr deacylase
LEDTEKGNRPSFGEAAEPHVAERLYEHFCTALAALGVPVESASSGHACGSISATTARSRSCSRRSQNLIDS